MDFLQSMVGSVPSPGPPGSWESMTRRRLALALGSAVGDWLVVPRLRSWRARDRAIFARARRAWHALPSCATSPIPQSLIPDQLGKRRLLRALSRTCQIVPFCATVDRPPIGPGPDRLGIMARRSRQRLSFPFSCDRAKVACQLEGKARHEIPPPLTARLSGLPALRGLGSAAAGRA